MLNAHSRNGFVMWLHSSSYRVFRGFQYTLDTILLKERGFACTKCNQAQARKLTLNKFTTFWFLLFEGSKVNIRVQILFGEGSKVNNPLPIIIDFLTAHKASKDFRQHSMCRKPLFSVVFRYSVPALCIKFAIYISAYTETNL